MIKTKVTYWIDGGIWTFVNEWKNMRHYGVLWVDIVHGEHMHRLLGADGYWVADDLYGVTFEDAHPKYGGYKYAMWQVTDDGMEFLGEIEPPIDAYIIRGIEIPDNIWKSITEFLPDE